MGQFKGGAKGGASREKRDASKEKREKKTESLEGQSLISPKDRRYKVGKLLGQGGFGAVYLVHHQVADADGSLTNGTGYAMKVEFRSGRHSVLKMEIKAMRALNRIKAKHACRMVDKGRHEKYNYVIMTEMKDSLVNLRKSCRDKKFSASTSLRCAIQMLAGIEELHRAGFLHRDIKPANYCVGRKETGQQRTIFILDFGISRLWQNQQGAVRRPRVGVAFRGTVRYASVTTHKNKELSRRDDLETWLYSVVELMTGDLPWRDVKDRDETGRQKEHYMKSAVQKLIDGTPAVFQHKSVGYSLTTYIAQLGYVDEPNYAWMYERLNKAMADGRFCVDDAFDWENAGDAAALPVVSASALRGAHSDDAIKLPSVKGQNDDDEDRT